VFISNRLNVDNEAVFSLDNDSRNVFIIDQRWTIRPYIQFG